jgi:hypothetical protein
MAAAGARELLLTLVVLYALAGAGLASPISSGAVTSALNARLKNLTDAFAPQVRRELGYCIQDTYVRTKIFSSPNSALYLDLFES